MKRLTFVNEDAAEKVQSLNIDGEPEDLSKVSEWYHSFYHGDDIRVLVDGEPQKVDMNGVFA